MLAHRLWMIRSALTTVLDLFAPLRCPLCGRRLTDGEICRACGLPDPGRVVRQLLPGPCLQLTGGTFAGDLRRVVHEFKYGDDPGARAILLAQMRLAVPRDLRWDALVPVPAHPVRVRERGLAVTEVLARGLARSTGLPVRRLLRRCRYTPSLTGQGAVDRHNILAGALLADPSTGALLLVDDVLTTGATFRACRRALLAAGAESVDLLAAAYTPPPEEVTRIVARAALW